MLWICIVHYRIFIILYSFHIHMHTQEHNLWEKIPLCIVMSNAMVRYGLLKQFALKPNSPIALLFDENTYFNRRPYLYHDDISINRLLSGFFFSQQNLHP